MRPLQKKDLKQLALWFDKNQRDFPWRKEQARPYRVWIAEIMSQQTQMAALVPYFQRFMTRFPTIQHLAAAEEAEVLTAWAGLGYYSRARNVHRAAKMISENFGENFPQTYLQWLELPGVGPYTAAAVVSQCFGGEEPVWDGNVVRVLSRLFARKDAHAPGFRAEFLPLLKSAMHGLSASAVNQGLMELGATVCTPKNPRCGKCIFSDRCSAYAQSAAADYPPPKKRKEFVDLKCQAWIRVRKGTASSEVYLERREQGQWYEGLWDFPSDLGGNRAPKKTGLHQASGQSVGVVRHAITCHRIQLEGFVLREKVVKVKPKANSGWFTLDALCSDQTPVPLSTIAKKLLRTWLRHIKEL